MSLTSPQVLVAESTPAPTQTPPATAGDLPSGEEMVARARSLRERLRELQPVHAELGTYSEEIHDEFTRLRLYDILRPKRYGGLELGLETFFQVVAEIATADPGVGWSFELGASHPYQFSSFFSERAQDEAYAAYPFVAASRAFPVTATVDEAEGGYVLSGRWDYNSGCTWSSHFMPCALIPDADGTPRLHMLILPREAYTIEDDWGQGRTIGLHASSSNSITVDGVFVPEYNVVPFNFRDYDWGDTGTPGYQLHGNPLYLGRTSTIFIAGLAVSQIGAAKASLEEYERLMSRGSSFPPRVPRHESPEYQRWFGQITSLSDSAETLLHATIAEFARRTTAWAEGGPLFGPDDDVRLRGQILQAAQLAGHAIDLAFTTAGSTSAAMTGTRLEKYYRDAAMYRTHIGAQFEVMYGSLGRTRLGIPTVM